MDRIADFFSQRSARRVVALAAFGGLLYLFRHLAILLLFFVTFERALGWCARTIAARTGVSRKQGLFITLGAILLLVAGVAWFGVGKTVRTFAAMQQSFPEKLQALRENPIVDKIEDQFGGMDALIENAKHYAGNALAAATAVGHFVLHFAMGFILAIVYVLEEDEIAAFWRKVEPRSIAGTLGRWFGHVADATIVTVQLQIIVAACNTLMTLPVLLIIGVPNVGALMLLIFVTALVPVIGNIVSGVTLSLLAYQQKGWIGVGIFVTLTFILHKIESYYLSPRLTARHVKMPGFLLIVSLIACEHLFGFKGLFLSFPILFVAGRIKTDFLEEDTGAAESPIDHTDDPSFSPPTKRAFAASGVELAAEPARVAAAVPVTEDTPTSDS
ncbi:MAG: AI-2E family transporter [Labilithrix sp.]|nr:AI-2E family transporter [Labilithrix sp.]MCW5817932.1 AI-2E family transporter [Labilithrix sp.]